MAGYRQDNFDLDVQEPIDEETRRSRWKAALVAAVYMTPLIFLWIWTDFPESFGVQDRGYGWGRALEEWYYSYLLLQRHRPLDLVTFFYMWGGVAAVVAWVARNRRKPNEKAPDSSGYLSTPSVFDDRQVAAGRWRLVLLFLASLLLLGAIAALPLFKGA